MIDWPRLEKLKNSDTLTISDRDFLFSTIEELKTEMMITQDERNWLRRQIDKRMFDK